MFEDVVVVAAVCEVELTMNLRSVVRMMKYVNANKKTIEVVIAFVLASVVAVTYVVLGVAVLARIVFVVFVVLVLVAAFVVSGL